MCLAVNDKNIKETLYIENGNSKEQIFKCARSLN